jgi:hypothetical protein
MRHHHAAGESFSRDVLQRQHRQLWQSEIVASAIAA